LSKLLGARQTQISTDDDTIVTAKCARYAYERSLWTLPFSLVGDVVYRCVTLLMEDMQILEEGVRKGVVRERENPRKYDPCRKTDTQQDRSRVMEWCCAERVGKSVWDEWSACVKNGCRQEKRDGSYFPSNVSLPDILDRQPSPPHVNSYAVRFRRYRRRDPRRHADYGTTPLRMTLNEFLRTQIRDKRTRV
jgi:hypothetical protein